MAAAGRRGKLSLKRNRNDDDKPSISFKKPAQIPTSEVWDRGINNSKVEPEMCVEDRLSSRLTTETGQRQEWISLPELAPWFGLKGKEKEDSPKHEIIKMGTVSIEWRPLPKHCQLCLVRTRHKRAVQFQELSAGRLGLETMSAAPVSGEQTPASLQRSKTSRNGFENSVRKETAKETINIGRTVREENLPVNENHTTPQTTNAGADLPLRDKHRLSKSFVKKIDAGKFQDHRKEHFQASNSQTKGVQALLASLNTEGNHKSAEEFEVERKRSRRDNQGSLSSTLKNVDLGRRTVRKEDLPQQPSTVKANVDLPPQDNHSRKFERKIDAGKLQIKIKKIDAVQNLAQDLKKEPLSAAKYETKTVKAMPSNFKTEGNHKAIELIEDFDFDRERAKRKQSQGFHSSTVQNAPQTATTIHVKNTSNESYVNVSVKDSNSMEVKSNDAQMELIEEFDFEKVRLKQSSRPESENSNSNNQTSLGKTSLKTVNQRSKDQFPSGSVKKRFPSPLAKKKSKMVNHSNSTIMSHFKKYNLPLESNKLGSVGSSPKSSEKLLTMQLGDVSRTSSPEGGEILDMKVLSPEIIVLDSDSEDEILPPSPNTQCSSSLNTSKRKLSEISFEKDRTAVAKKPKLVDTVSTGPGMSGSLATRLILDQKPCSSSLAWQKQPCGRTITSQATKTLTGIKTTEIRNDSKVSPSIATKKPLFKRKPDKPGVETERIEEFTRKTDVSLGSIGVPKQGTPSQATLPIRQNFTKTNDGKMTASTTMLSKSLGGKTPNIAKHLRQKASLVERSHTPIKPKQVVRAPETQRRVPDVANQWIAKTNQSGFQTATDNHDVHSRLNDRNYQGSYPKPGITTHTPMTHKGINRDIQHPDRGINKDQQANRGTKQDQNFKRDGHPREVIEVCPLCTKEFQQGWSQLQKDEHIAKCLFLSGAEVTW
ncbi:uncharacterized protein [Asterias amurensis]|uniref:uncharacterized protein isoform X2 n=1 Tax=Asterias amurensis TaxID=7602 RepID=UPI003AB3B206